MKLHISKLYEDTWARMNVMGTYFIAQWYDFAASHPVCHLEIARDFDLLIYDCIYSNSHDNHILEGSIFGG